MKSKLNNRDTRFLRRIQNGKLHMINLDTMYSSSQLNTLPVGETVQQGTADIFGICV